MERCCGEAWLLGEFVVARAERHGKEGWSIGKARLLIFRGSQSSFGWVFLFLRGFGFSIDIGTVWNLLGKNVVLNNEMCLFEVQF